MKKKVILAITLLAVIFMIVSCAKNGEKSSSPTGPTVVEMYYRDTVTVLPESAYMDSVLTEGASPTEGATFTSSQWHSLSQIERNQAILEAAYRDYLNFAGRSTGYNCKTWVQRVVSIASTGVEWPPSTSMPNQCPLASGYTWCPSSHVIQKVQNICPSNFNYYFRLGQIIQMWYGGNYMPHTAIVWSVSPDVIGWIDCSFVGVGVVGIHYLTRATFTSKVIAYTVYEIY